MSPRSFVTLGFYFVRQIIIRMFGRARALSAFKHDYVQIDKLYPLAKDQRQTIAASSLCTYCMQCRTTTGLLIPAEARDLAMTNLSSEVVEQLKHAEARCPQRIPLTSVANLIHAQVS